MVADNTIFRYKTRRGILHRVPACAKLLVFAPLSVMCMSLPIPALASGIACAILAAFLCGFSPREQITDLKPAFFYAALMYALSFFSALLEPRDPMPPLSLLRAACIPRADFFFIVLRLTLIIQLSALLFRTSTTLEIRDCVARAEIAVRRVLSRVPFLRKKISDRPRCAESVALFAGFIPEIFHTWTELNLAWRARGGKNGIRKTGPLVFALLTVSFEKAARKAKALAARDA